MGVGLHQSRFTRKTLLVVVLLAPTGGAVRSGGAAANGATADVAAGVSEPGAAAAAAAGSKAEPEQGLRFKIAHIVGSAIKWPPTDDSPDSSVAVGPADGSGFSIVEQEQGQEKTYSTKLVDTDGDKTIQWDHGAVRASTQAEPPGGNMTNTYLSTTPLQASWLAKFGSLVNSSAAAGPAWHGGLRPGEDGWLILEDYDVFVGENHKVYNHKGKKVSDRPAKTKDEIRMCKLTCKDTEGVNAFVVWDGRAYFRHKTARECEERRKKTPGATLWIWKGKGYGGGGSTARAASTVARRSSGRVRGSQHQRTRENHRRQANKLIGLIEGSWYDREEKIAQVTGDFLRFNPKRSIADSRIMMEPQKGDKAFSIKVQGTKCVGRLVNKEEIEWEDPKKRNWTRRPNPNHRGDDAAVEGASHEVLPAGNTTEARMVGIATRAEAKNGRTVGIATRVGAEFGWRDQGERRADPNAPSNRRYFHREFLQYYGEEEGQRLWDAAKRTSTWRPTQSLNASNAPQATPQQVSQSAPASGATPGPDERRPQLQAGDLLSAIQGTWHAMEGDTATETARVYQNQIIWATSIPNSIPNSEITIVDADRFSIQRACDGKIETYQARLVRKDGAIHIHWQTDSDNPYVWFRPSPYEWLETREIYEAWQILVRGQTITKELAWGSLLTTQLPETQLEQIWYLTDMGKEDIWDLARYALALHFVRMTKSGHSLPDFPQKQNDGGIMMDYPRPRLRDWGIAHSKEVIRKRRVLTNAEYDLLAGFPRE